MQHHHAFRSGTRYKLQKGYKDKGKVSLSKFFQGFEVGEAVILKAEPAIQKGMYYPRFHGKSGLVVGKRGECYLVQVRDKNKEKLLIIHPVHLKKVE
jgi:large subunit ribosomal protein L21e